MSTFTATESGTAINVPVGIHNATIERFEDVVGKFGEQVKFILRIEGTDDEVWAFVNSRFTSKARLPVWYSAVTGMAVDFRNGKTYDVADMVGRRCRVRVVEQTRLDGTAGKRIADLLPPAAAAPPAPEPETKPSDPDSRCALCGGGESTEWKYTARGKLLCSECFADMAS
jgi:hypothetical protein